jgi:hypothetical protein
MTNTSETGDLTGTKDKDGVLRARVAREPSRVSRCSPGGSPAPAEQPDPLPCRARGYLPACPMDRGLPQARPQHPGHSSERSELSRWTAGNTSARSPAVTPQLGW